MPRRSPVTHKMKPWVVKVFIQILPKVLFIERPKKSDSIDEDDDDDDEVNVVKHGEIMSGVFDVPSEIDKYLGYDRGYSFDYDIPPPLPASRYCGPRAICATGRGGSGSVGASAAGAAGSNDTVVNMASDDDEEDAIELDPEDEYDDMFSPTTTTDDGLASPTFENHHHQHHVQHQQGCPVDQRPSAAAVAAAAAAAAADDDPDAEPESDADAEPEVPKHIVDAKFIAQHIKNQDKFDAVSAACFFFFGIQKSKLKRIRLGGTDIFRYCPNREYDIDF